MAAFTIDAEFVKGSIPARRKESHKGANGVVCLVGGSRVYHGAPFLASMGALRTGVDLVYLAVPAPLAAPIRSLSPDIIVFPLPDSKLTRGNAARLESWLPRLGCLGLGPGLGPQNPDELVRAVSKLSEKANALVIDADALRPQVLKAVKHGATVVTPHAGEFERMFGRKVPAELEARVGAVEEAAKENSITVLLKGPTDVVSDGERVGLNTVHSPSMTVGGTGDVLTGITTGLAAKGLGPFEAACCAAHINGLAGVEATRELGLHITASDVVNRIANAMKQFDRVE